jgi:hypothetical protein
MKSRMIVALAAAACAVQSGCSGDAGAREAHRRSAERSAAPFGRIDAADPAAKAYSGTDSRGVPHYAKRSFSNEEVSILRRVFGVVSPSHLYLSDSTESATLKYDPEPKPCAACYVNSFRVGFVSVRAPGETWDGLERRVKVMHRGAFAPGALVSSTSVSTMDPDIQADVQTMLAAARRQGFQLHVRSTYRSPEREAMLMAAGGGRTYTLTSLHSYGRAIDITVGDGNLRSQRTRADWVAFRRWVTAYPGGEFRVLGTPERTWDWAHVEMPSGSIGFRNIEQALAAGRKCLSRGIADRCEFPPHLPAN